MTRQLKNAIEDFIRGDDKLFTVIYELQYSHVYNISFQYTKDEYEAEDIPQETFIAVYKYK